MCTNKNVPGIQCYNSAPRPLSFLPKYCTTQVLYSSLESCRHFSVTMPTSKVPSSRGKPCALPAEYALRNKQNVAHNCMKVILYCCCSTHSMCLRTRRGESSTDFKFRGFPGTVSGTPMHKVESIADVHNKYITML